MSVRRFAVPITVNGGGSATVYSPYLSGKLVSIRYVKDDFANGVDFTITAEASGETLWAEADVNASATRHPRAPTHSPAGAAALYAALGEPVNNKIALSRDRVKFIIAGAGNATSGTFHLTIDG